jgi:hypothetical protein
MPINLVEASFDQIRRIPGVVVQNINIQACNNPTFAPDGTNLLADHAPYPQPCDKRGPTQCLTGTGGARNATAISKRSAAGGAGAGTAGSSGTGGAGSGGAGGASGSGPGTTNGTNGTSGAGAGQGQQQCDPDTGVCTTGSGAGSDPSALAAASPRTLPTEGGWGSTQTLMVLAVLFALALILGPAFTSRALARRSQK